MSTIGRGGSFPARPLLARGAINRIRECYYLGGPLVTARSPPSYRHRTPAVVWARPAHNRSIFSAVIDNRFRGRRDRSERGVISPLLCTRKGQHCEGLANRLPHCGISVVLTLGFWFGSGHKREYPRPRRPTSGATGIPRQTDSCRAVLRTRRSVANRSRKRLHGLSSFWAD
jgi:hypothetical protein